MNENTPGAGARPEWIWLPLLLACFVSGLILLFEGSLRVGDYIELDTGLRGIVKEINTRATVVRTNDSIDVVVPNSELVS